MRICNSHLDMGRKISIASSLLVTVEEGFILFVEPINYFHLDIGFATQNLLIWREKTARSVATC